MEERVLTWEKKNQSKVFILSTRCVLLSLIILFKALNGGIKFAL